MSSISVKYQCQVSVSSLNVKYQCQVSMSSINVKYQCHKATRTVNVTQSPAWLMQLSYPVDSKLYPNLCIARDCFMILMLRNFQFNALSCGNQRPNLPYKKAWQDMFGGFSLHHFLPETLPLCYWNLCFWTSTFSNNNLYFTSIHSVPSVTSHLQLINQEAIYTSLWFAVDLNFNS
jgi:hypothetical protein